MVAEVQKAKSWVPITGRWTVDGDLARYLQPDEPDPTGILLSDVRLTKGIVAASITVSETDDAGRLLIGYRSRKDRYITTGIGGYGAGFVISEYVPGIGWGRLEAAGNSENLDLSRPYHVKVQLDGQVIRLTVDGIRVLEHVSSEPLAGNQLGLFAFGNGQIAFSDFGVATEAPTAFVAMQFTEPFAHLFEEVILPISREMGIEAYRVSDVYGPGIILQDIIQGIAEAGIVIVEITPANPNVFYELGYSHALNKPTILLAQRGQTLPFDIRGFRVIFYDDSIRGKSGLEEDLRRHLSAILRD